MHIEENVSLAPFTTLRIGGPARYFTTVADEADLEEALGFAGTRGLAVFILGGGSNLLVRDEGFSGLILHIALPPSIRREDDGDAVLLEVSAGTDWDALVRETCEQGLTGMECLAGIPGLVGASPIQNIGAYGQEAASTIVSLRAFDRATGEFKVLRREECGFAYRTSIFNSSEANRYVITSVSFRLRRDGAISLSYPDLKRYFAENAHPAPLEVYHAVRSIRDRKGMVIHPESPSPDTRSAGSFFKNPVAGVGVVQVIAQVLSVDAATVPHWPVQGSAEVKLPAAWLIEQAGFPKGFALAPDSPVSISTRHTLALVNRSGTASCADLLGLRDTIIGRVRERFGVTLEQEPVLLG